MNALIDLKVPLQSELLTTVRLLTGGVCSLAGLGLEESEDCKVCVTESLLLLKHAGFLSARLIFTREEGIRVAVQGEEGGGEAVSSMEEEISVALLQALVEDLKMERTESGVTSVSFGFGQK